MTSRSDALPHASGVLLAGLGVAGAATQMLRHRRVMRGMGNESFLETGSGNLLAYRMTEPTGVSAEAPVLVFEAGLASTAEYWYWAEADLGLDHPTLVYSRAGYGRSRFRGKEPFTLHSAVSDLQDLIRHTCGDRPVVIIGHSLGGYLALRAADETRGRVRGICLLDPSHPGQLLRSSAQAQGAEQVSLNLALIPSSLRLGLGWLIDIPVSLKRFPSDVRSLVQDQYRDWGLWSTAKREWRATQQEFLGYKGDLSKISVPTCLVAADRTRSTDKTVDELYREMAAAAPRSEMHVVKKAGHDDLLSHKEVFHLIRQFGKTLGAGD